MAANMDEIKYSNNMHSYQENNESKIMPPFGNRDRIGYMCGDLGITLILGLVNSFLTIYYTNILGMSGIVVGILFFIARSFDGVTDVIIGRFIDTRKLGTNGRFKPIIAKGKYGFCLVAILLFLPYVQDFSMIGKQVYIFITYISFGLLIDFVQIPYGSLASAMSTNTLDKADLSMFRSVGSAIGGSCTAMIIPLSIYVVNDQGIRVLSASRFFLMAIILAVCAFVLFILLNMLTVERIQIKKIENIKISTMLKSLWQNKPLIALVCADIFCVINQSGLGTMMTYLFNDYFKNGLALSIAGFFTYGCPLILAPFMHRIIKKYGKKEVVATTLIMSSVLFFLLGFLRITNSWLYLILMFMATILYSFFNLMIWALINDVIDYHQYLTGYREDATIYSLNMFSRKIGQTLAGGGSGILLSIIGYESHTNGGTQQKIAVVNKLYLSANILPGILLLCGGIVLLYGYSLNSKQLSQVQNRLKTINE